MKNLFMWEHSLAGDYISGFRHIWQAIAGLSEYIIGIGEGLDHSEFNEISYGVWISREAQISNSALILPPSIICRGAELRHNAYIRGSVIVGEECVVGNSCEIKNSVLFDECQIPHFNYVGDSILGYRVHFGAGSVTSNLKSDSSEVVVRIENIKYYTGLRKLGALVGDGTQIGCNVTLNPGCVIGKNCTVYPNLSIRGYIPDNTICKCSKELIQKRSES